jgi:hypothetical protein
MGNQPSKRTFNEASSDASEQEVKISANKHLKYTTAAIDNTKK